MGGPLPASSVQGIGLRAHGHCKEHLRALPQDFGDGTTDRPKEGKRCYCGSEEAPPAETSRGHVAGVRQWGTIGTMCTQIGSAHPQESWPGVSRSIGANEHV